MKKEKPESTSAVESPPQAPLSDGKESQPVPVAGSARERKEQPASLAKEGINRQLHVVESKLEKKSWWGTIKGWGTKCYDKLKGASFGWKAAGIGAAAVSAALMFGFDPFSISKFAATIGIKVGKFLFPRTTQNLWYAHIDKKYAGLAPNIRETGHFDTDWELMRGADRREVFAEYGMDNVVVAPGFLERLFGISRNLFSTYVPGGY